MRTIKGFNRFAYSWEPPKRRGFKVMHMPRQFRNGVWVDEFYYYLKEEKASEVDEVKRIEDEIEKTWARRTKQRDMDVSIIPIPMEEKQEVKPIEGTVATRKTRTPHKKRKEKVVNTEEKQVLGEAKEILNTPIWLPVYAGSEDLVGWCDITRGQYISVEDLTPEGLGGKVYRDIKIRGDLSMVLRGRSVLKIATTMLSRKPRVNRKTKRRYPVIETGQVRMIGGKMRPTNYGMTNAIAEILIEQQVVEPTTGTPMGMTIGEVSSALVAKGWKNAVDRPLHWGVGVALATAARVNAGGHGIYRVAFGRYAMKVKS